MSASVALRMCGIGWLVGRGDVLEDPREEVVAGQHADAVAEVDRGRVDAAARVARCRRRRRGSASRRGSAPCTRRAADARARRRADRRRAEQREARAQPLAAGVEHAAHGFGDQRVVGRERVAEEIFDQPCRSRSARGSSITPFPTWTAIAPPPEPHVAHVGEAGAAEALGELVGVGIVRQRIRQVAVGGFRAADERRRPAARARRSTG